MLEENRFKCLDVEYSRIRTALYKIWLKRESGWGYELDFHAAEARRLLMKLRIDRVYHQVMQGYNCRLEELLRTYELLEDLLIELAGFLAENYAAMGRVGHRFAIRSMGTDLG